MKITVTLEAYKLVPITSNDGGYQIGECMLCGAYGHLDRRLGSTASEKVMRNRLIHTSDCQIGQALDIKAEAVQA